jgi:predicted extracellular nuclease
MRLHTLILLFLFSAIASGQKATFKPKKSFTVVFYNVENLFDTINDPLTQDDEFTPDSEKNWNTERYRKKLEDISKVLSSINNKELPEIIGLCEIENRKVLQDLIKTGKLKKEEYGIVHEESPDIRGIDVALLYRKDEFDYISHKRIPVIFRFDSTLKTRDILYVKGKTTGSDIFHIFVNHWSSRTESQQQTERKRIFSAVTLRKSVDSIFNFEPEAKIIIIGDFNDEPTNMSLFSILNATNKQKNAGPRDLYNLMYDKHNFENSGTYSYKGNWNMLDNLIVSKSLITDKKNYHIDYNGGKIYRESWIMYDNPKIGELTPNKTYAGNIYFGGVSDHLPVYMVLQKK